MLRSPIRCAAQLCILSDRSFAVGEPLSAFCPSGPVGRSDFRNQTSQPDTGNSGSVGAGKASGISAAAIVSVDGPLKKHDDLFLAEPAAFHVLSFQCGQNELQAGLGQRGNVIREGIVRLNQKSILGSGRLSCLGAVCRELRCRMNLFRPIRKGLGRGA